MSLGVREVELPYLDSSLQGLWCVCVCVESNLARGLCRWIMTFVSASSSKEVLAHFGLKNESERRGMCQDELQDPMLHFPRVVGLRCDHTHC